MHLSQTILPVYVWCCVNRSLVKPYKVCETIFGFHGILLELFSNLKEAKKNPTEDVSVRHKLMIITIHESPWPQSRDTILTTALSWYTACA